MLAVQVISTEPWSTCAILPDRRVVCHGRPRHAKPLPDRASELWHSSDVACRRRPDRTVACESSSRDAPLELGADVARLAVTERSACAVHTSGAVDCYRDSLRSPPHRIPGLHDAVAIVMGSFGDRTCALRAGGTVACWNDNQSEAGKSVALRTIPGITDAIDLAAGWNYGCALRRGGVVACWGRSPWVATVTSGASRGCPTVRVRLSSAIAIS